MEPAPAPAPEPPCCPAHPEARADATCDRCGVFLCPGCALALGPTVVCRRCRELVEQGAPSGLAMAAGILGLVGLGCLFVPGLLGLGLAELELRRIAQGRSPRGGHKWALAGRALGWLNLFFAVVAGVGALVVLRGAR